MERTKTPLAILLILTLCVAFAACNSEGEPAPAPSAAPESPSSAVSVPAPEPEQSFAPEPEPVAAPEQSSTPAGEGASGNSALDNIPLSAVPAWFESSIWLFDGGMVDNQEMDDAAGQQILDQLFAGRLDLSVNPSGATMVYGEGDAAAMLSGSWKISGKEVAMSFPDVGSYIARFTEVTGEPVMMLSIADNITFYLIPLPTVDLSAAMGKMPVTPIPDLYRGDTMIFAGALENGRKLDVIDAQGVLDELFLGNMNLMFQDIDRADLTYSTQNIVVPGVWQLQGDILGFAFYPAFGEPICYTGCFSQDDDIPVPVLVLASEEGRAFYCSMNPRDAEG